MAAPHFKPSHTAIKAYYDQHIPIPLPVAGEGLGTGRFPPALDSGPWTLDLPVRPDGALRDDFNLRRGFWEAKDSGDKLNVEIRNRS